MPDGRCSYVILTLFAREFICRHIRTFRPFAGLGIPRRYYLKRWDMIAQPVICTPMCHVFGCPRLEFFARQVIRCTGPTVCTFDGARLPAMGCRSASPPTPSMWGTYCMNGERHADAILNADRASSYHDTEHDCLKVDVSRRLYSHLMRVFNIVKSTFVLRTKDHRPIG